MCFQNKTNFTNFVSRPAPLIIYTLNLEGGRVRWGKTHLRALLPLVVCLLPFNLSVGMGHNGASRHMQAFCYRGLRCLLHPLLPVPRRLSPHSFRVGLGRFPRCLSTQLRRRNAVYLCPVGRRLGSESHLFRSKLRSAIPLATPKAKTPQDALWSWLLAEQQQGD